MPFKVTARTILQLGGELISSDGIAFYELIKNAFDAGSKKVIVDVVMRVPVETLEAALADLAASTRRNRSLVLSRVKQRVRDRVDLSTRGIAEWLDELDAANDPDELMSHLLDANSIEFTDFGHGMSIDDLDHNYLTVGTPHRQIQRTQTDRLLLGEKGIGRLSAMRLGRSLYVQTATSADSHWNILEIDWDEFAEEVGQLVEEVDVEPEVGEKIARNEKRGTTISIGRLNDDWSLRKLTEIANNDIARLLDPFSRSKRISIVLKFNGHRVLVPRMNDILTEKAHAILDADFEIVENDDGKEDVHLSGNIAYLVSSATGSPLKGRERSFDYSYDDLCGLFRDIKDIEIDLDTCVSLGPFTVNCYWFNRRIVKKITINEEMLDLKALIRQWSGGLSLYRDGFRVPPYGSGDDDWLDLDRGALASQGYKVNRAQLLGKVDITSADNPMLVDQTNREGLRDCREKRALVVLCKWVLENELRAYLKEVDDELRDRSRVSFGDLSEQLDEVEEQITESLDVLTKTHNRNPALGLAAVENRLRSAYNTVVDVVGEMQSSVEATEDEKAKLLHLAALGLAVEKLAHELSRTTRHALESLTNIDHVRDSAALRESAEIQLRSLQKRLQNLDPQLGPKRNRKEDFDLRECLQLAVDAYAGAAQRHDINLTLDFEPNRPIMLHTVKACILQVVHNLLDNSFYWLTARRRRHDIVARNRQVAITAYARRGCFEVFDNGPGIAPENRDRIFKEFYTLKKSGEGKGLGLYLSRELMELYGGSIELSDNHVNENGRLTTFIVDFSGMKK